MQWAFLGVIAMGCAFSGCRLELLDLSHLSRRCIDVVSCILRDSIHLAGAGG